MYLADNTWQLCICSRWLKTSSRPLQWRATKRIDPFGHYTCWFQGKTLTCSLWISERDYRWVSFETVEQHSSCLICTQTELVVDPGMTNRVIHQTNPRDQLMSYLSKTWDDRSRTFRRAMDLGGGKSWIYSDEVCITHLSVVPPTDLKSCFRSLHVMSRDWKMRVSVQIRRIFRFQIRLPVWREYRTFNMYNYTQSQFDFLLEGVIFYQHDHEVVLNNSIKQWKSLTMELFGFHFYNIALVSWTMALIDSKAAFKQRYIELPLQLWICIRHWLHRTSSAFQTSFCLWHSEQIAHRWGIPHFEWCSTGK